MIERVAGQDIGDGRSVQMFRVAESFGSMPVVGDRYRGGLVRWVSSLERLFLVEHGPGASMGFPEPDYEAMRAEPVWSRRFEMFGFWTVLMESWDGVSSWGRRPGADEIAAAARERLAAI